MAEPAGCTRRSATRTPTLLASARASEATTNSKGRPQRSPAPDAVGEPVGRHEDGGDHHEGTTHESAPSPAESWEAPSMSGNVTLTIVVSRNAMNARAAERQLGRASCLALRRMKRR